jgi:tetratricopeptide (TPR) repeat protein
LKKESLKNWELAKNNYAMAMQLMKKDLTASLGYARCMIELSKYNRAVRYLKKHPSIKDTSDFWVMASIAYRKQLDYTKAKECILEALQLDPQSQEAAQEKTLLEKLQA